MMTFLFSETSNVITSKLAVTSLLHRFKEVLTKYTEDMKLSGKCPLPRHRLAEISFVLQAIATLIDSLKKANEDKGKYFPFHFVHSNVNKNQLLSLEAKIKHNEVSFIGFFALRKQGRF